jgi:hypothetical protein
LCKKSQNIRPREIKTRYDYNLTIMKSPKPANDCFRCHHVEELQTCSPGHASDTWHDEIVFWNNHMIIYYKYISIIKINNFKFSVRYHSVTELEATLLIKYTNYFTICLCYLKLTVYSNIKFCLVPSTIWMNVIWRWVLWYIAKSNNFFYVFSIICRQQTNSRQNVHK